jgi:hypothetical protein
MAPDGAGVGKGGIPKKSSKLFSLHQLRAAGRRHHQRAMEEADKGRGETLGPRTPVPTFVNCLETGSVAAQARCDPPSRDRRLYFPPESLGAGSQLLSRGPVP